LQLVLQAMKMQVSSGFDVEACDGTRPTTH
jgi:hypothetical protein